MLFEKSTPFKIDVLKSILLISAPSKFEFEKSEFSIIVSFKVILQSFEFDITLNSILAFLKEAPSKFTFLKCDFLIKELSKSTPFKLELSIDG